MLGETRLYRIEKAPLSLRRIAPRFLFLSEEGVCAFLKRNENLEAIKMGCSGDDLQQFGSTLSNEYCFVACEGLSFKLLAQEDEVKHIFPKLHDDLRASHTISDERRAMVTH